MEHKAKMAEAEGAEAWTRFQAGMKRPLSATRSEIQRRVAAQRALSEANPKRRGLKQKVKPSASHWQVV